MGRGAFWLLFTDAGACEAIILPCVSRMKRVLLTGGAGFIGSHVADALLGAGMRVTVLDDLSTGRRERVPAGVEFMPLDIRAPAARSLVASRRFDLLVHLAAQADVRVSVDRPAFDADVNLGGLLNLLGGVAAGGIARVVFASSGGVVYGPAAQVPTPETHSKAPTSPYGVSKLAGEHYLRVLGELAGVETVALRFANVYGPRQDPTGEAGVVAIFLGRLLAGEPLTVFGDGHQTRDFVHVHDVARATELAASRPLLRAATPDESALNIGTGLETSVRELIQGLESATGRTAAVRFAPARSGELRRNALAVGRAREVLGWSPARALLPGLRDLTAHFHATGS